MSHARPKTVLFAIFIFIFWRGFAQQKPLVVTTTSIFADMAANIGGDAVDVKSIVPIGSDPHLYKPTSNDAKLIAAANLVLYNGLTFEDWLSEMIANSDTKVNAVILTKGINVIENAPHAWMDASQGLIYIENIKNALVELVPDQKEMFEFNYHIYRQQLQDMDIYIQKQINTIPTEKRILITSYKALRYYAERYGLQIMSLDAGRLEKSNATVFIETTEMQGLQQEKPAVADKLYINSLSHKDSLASNYLDLLKYDTNVIVEAWKENKATLQPNKPKTGIISIIWSVLLLLLLLRVAYLVF